MRWQRKRAFAIPSLLGSRRVGHLGFQPSLYAARIILPSFFLSFSTPEPKSSNLGTQLSMYFYTFMGVVGVGRLRYVDLVFRQWAFPSNCNFKEVKTFSKPWPMLLNFQSMLEFVGLYTENPCFHAQSSTH